MTEPRYTSAYGGAEAFLDDEYRPTAYVHQLVAIASGADPHRVFGDECYVFHRNGVRFDNREENIRVGRVGSELRTDTATFYTTERGYERVQTRIYDKGTTRSVAVHILVAIAEGADPHRVFAEDTNIHHANHHPFDNRPSNLEVLDRSTHGHFHGERRAAGD